MACAAFADGAVDSLCAAAGFHTARPINPGAGNRTMNRLM